MKNNAIMLILSLLSLPSLGAQEEQEPVKQAPFQELSAQLARDAGQASLLAGAVIVIAGKTPTQIGAASQIVALAQSGLTALSYITKVNLYNIPWNKAISGLAVATAVKHAPTAKRQTLVLLTAVGLGLVTQF